MSDAPEHGGPEHGGPEHDGPEHAMPQHAAPEHAAPQHGARITFLLASSHPVAYRVEVSERARRSWVDARYDGAAWSFVLGDPPPPAWTLRFAEQVLKGLAKRDAFPRRIRRWRGDPARPRV